MGRSRAFDLECTAIQIQKLEEKTNETLRIQVKKPLIIISSGVNGIVDSPALFCIDGMIRSLLRNSWMNRSILDEFDITFIPMLNPDSFIAPTLSQDMLGSDLS